MNCISILRFVDLNHYLIWKLKFQKNAIIVGSIYKPPDTSTVDFNMHVNDLLRTISQVRQTCIIMGDFNIDLLTTDTNLHTADFIYDMFSHNVLSKK